MQNRKTNSDPADQPQFTPADVQAIARCVQQSRARLKTTEDGWDLRLYGIVGDEWEGFTDDTVADMLDEVTGTGTVRINSPGGFIYQGMAIYTLLKEADVRLVKIDGLAASMGSVIALAGDRIEMARGSMMMIHNPWNLAIGDSRELRKAADVMDKMKESIIDIYQARTGQERELLAEMMDEETWLTAEEAVEWGFADAVSDEEGDPAAVNLSILSDTKNMPQRLSQALQQQASATRREPAAEAATPETHKHEVQNMSDPKQTPSAAQESAENNIDLEAERKAAVEAERARVKAIRNMVAEANLDHEFGQKLIDDGLSETEAKTQVDNLSAYLAKNQPEKEIRSHTTIEITRDERDTQRAGATKAILNRFNPRQYQIEGDDPAREFAGMRLFEMARTFAERSGQSVKGRNANEVARAALHTTSDFPDILENVIGKALRDRYELAPRTFVQLARQSTLPDYKQVSRAQLGEAPVLQQVLEGGEYTYGTIGDAAEKYQLFKYGKMLAVSREVIINDDLDAITRIPAAMGAAAGQLENQLFWAHLTGNPTMHDGNALFSSNHGNLDNSGATISITSIGAGREAMRTQTGLDGNHYINVSPSYLVVPAALETTAEQFVSTNLMPEAAGNINPFAGRLQVISEPRLDADDANAWYLFADPNMIDTLEYAYLQGEEGPQIETRDGFEVDGLEVKVRHNFGVKALDWRGLYKNVGA